jgi:hypothetical protein
MENPNTDAPIVKDDKAKVKDESLPSRKELLEIIDNEEDHDDSDSEDSAQPELTDREKLAVEQGWQTEADWVASGKDAKTWRPAESWLDRGDFFKTIAALNNKVQSQEKLIAAAFDQGRKLEQAKLTEQIKELKEQRTQLRQSGDFEAADKIDDKIDAAKEKQSAPLPKAPTQITPPPEFAIFKQRNPWYDKDVALHYAADGIGSEFLRQNPGANTADLYWHVEQVMSQRFPELKGKPTSVPPSPASPGAAVKGNNANAGASSKLESSMSSMEKEIMRTLIRMGTFKNKEEYLKEYAAAPRRTR